MSGEDPAIGNREGVTVRMGDLIVKPLRKEFLKVFGFGRDARQLLIKVCGDIFVDFIEQVFFALKTLINRELADARNRGHFFRVEDVGRVGSATWIPASRMAVSTFFGKGVLIPFPHERRITHQ